MEAFSALLVLCEGNPPVTGKFDAFFFVSLDKQTAELPVIWAAMAFLWRHNIE